MRLQSNRYLISSLLSLAVSAVSPAADVEASLDKKPDALAEAVMSIFRKAGVDEKSLGVSIVDLQSDVPLFQLNESRVFSPASSAKILTAYVALKRLGVDYRFETKVQSKDLWDPRGFLKGDLYVIGSGDPTVTTQSLFELALQLKKKGLKRIEGSVVFDSSVFDGDQPDPLRIESDSTRPFNASVSGLNLNENVFRAMLSSAPGDNKTEFEIDPPNAYVQVKNLVQRTASNESLGVSGKRISAVNGREVFELRGRIARDQKIPVSVEMNVLHPANYFASAFVEVLGECGIRLKNRVPKLAKAPARLKTLANVSSAPLSFVVAEMNKSSRNVLADALVKLLGHEVYGGEGSVERGLQVIHEEALRLGINSAGFKFVSGSGLTRYNRMSPEHFTRLFHEAFEDFDVFPEWLSSLSIAGIDGTLEKKMRGNPAFGRLRGKTGTIDGVSSLVGLVKTRGGRLLSYAALINVENGRAPQSRKWHNDFGRLLTTYEDPKKP